MIACIILFGRFFVWIMRVWSQALCQYTKSLSLLLKNQGQMIEKGIRVYKRDSLTWNRMWNRYNQATMKRILCLCRKDIKHIRHGGAEVVIHQYLKGLVALWYEVTQISTNSGQNPHEEIVDGVYIVRLWTIHSIYFLFPRYYLRYLQGKYDLIIDHAGGIPLLAPWYAHKIPIIFLVHHVGTKERSEYFIQWIGMWWIGDCFRYIYNHFVLLSYRLYPTITVSEWTAHELRVLWFTQVYVLKNTTDRDINTQYQKTKKHRLLMIGRVVPNKQIDHGLRIIHQLQWQGYDYHLDIVGNTQDNIEYQKLQGLIHQLSIQDHIHFHGKIDHDHLIALMQGTQYLLLTSDKEWFGVVVLEANTQWIPALWYDIPGINEAICDGQNGILFPKNDHQSIASYIIHHQSDYQVLQNQTLSYIASYPRRSHNIDILNKIILSYQK